MLIQVHLFISGQVQDVGFRQFIKFEARKLGTAGWTRNTEDGKVEAVLQGEKEQIEELVSKCRRGPFLAQVKNVEIKREEIKETLREFIVRKTKDGLGD